MRVIFSESGRLAEASFSLACRQWPEDDIAVVAFAFPYFASAFTWPRTIHYQDLPLVMDPRYRPYDPDPLAGQQCFRVWLRQGDVFAEKRVVSMPVLRDLCAKATSAMLADRIFYQPVMTFELFVEHFMPHLVGGEHSLVALLTGSERTLESEWEWGLAKKKSSSDQDYRSLLNEARIKRYFDYNWHLNGNVVLGDLYRKITGERTPIHISKSMLLVLYILRKVGSVDQAGFSHIAVNWRGWSRSGEVCEIGTTPSRHDILSNLVKVGLVTETAKTSTLEHISLDDGRRTSAYTRMYYALSGAGEAFCQALHKDCYDPFQPHRLKKWRGMAFSQAKPQIDRYLKTYFGKQVRFQAKLFIGRVDIEI